MAITKGMSDYNPADDEGEFEIRHRTPAEARAACAARWEGQSAKFPYGMRNIDRRGYIQVNWRAAQRYAVKVSQ